MTHTINYLEKVHNLKAESELLKWLHSPLSTTTSQSYMSEIVGILKDLLKSPPGGVSCEKIIRSIALHTVSSGLSGAKEVKAYQSALGQKNNGILLGDALRREGIESYASSVWKPSGINKTDDREIRTVSELFIKVMQSLRQQVKLEAEKLGTSTGIIIDEKNLHDPGLFSIRKIFQTNNVDWYSPPILDNIDFSTKDIQNSGLKFIESCGIPTNAIQMHFADLPFWGLEFNLQLSGKAAVICGKPTGIQGLSTLMHELGHAVDCVNWKGSFADFFFREPAITETFAVMAQRLLENPDLYPLVFGISEKKGIESARHILKNKKREFAYMFVLMDLDRYFWGEDEITIDSCIDVYRNSCKEHFGITPASPFGFCVEQIHYLYPNYMANYFLAELFGSSILSAPSTIPKYNDTMLLSRKNTVASLLPELNQMAARRLAEISGGHI